MSKLSVVELRCDQHPSRMFGKLLSEGKPTISENLMEFKCRDCAKRLGVGTVLHRFNIVGELVETKVM